TEQVDIETLMQMPEPQPDPEMEFEKAKFEDESQRAWEDLDIRRTTAEAGAVKNIADAEAAEEGDQMALYQQYMKSMQDDDLASMKLDQGMQQHQQKMQLQEMQQRQKMRQQEEMHRQKLAQQSQPPVGGNNGTGRDN
ncbi:MAG: hypothetical protein KJO69_06550, partial [Gammaproteobacteria bacterium]|nr:hypothetical protein [Gammaproteobacteria bacterium]